MCCVIESIVKYVLFFANCVFSLAGIGLVSLGIALLVNVGKIVILQELVIYNMAIAAIVVGAVVFLVAFLGCCGAIRESRCFLMMYSVIMLLLAAGKIYLAVVLFQGLYNIYELVEEWIGAAFNDNNMREAFHVLEAAFRCCGTTGPDSYTGILPELPRTCCALPRPDDTCYILDAYRGCNLLVGAYFDSFGRAIGGIVIAVIAAEVVALVFGCFLCNSIGNKRHKTY